MAWSAEADPLSWQVVCWDSGDAAIARLRLSGRHRRATFAGLALFPQPFTIAVSGLGPDGSVLWQAGLADLYLRSDRSAAREGASERMRTRNHQGNAGQGRRETVSPKRPKKDPAPVKSGKTSKPKPKPKKKTARGKSPRPESTGGESGVRGRKLDLGAADRRNDREGFQNYGSPGKRGIPRRESEF